MKQIFTIALASLAIAFTSCSKPTQTIQALKDAATGEANASAKYAAFAERAAADSLPKIAAMLRATSAAENIHMKNHLAELEKLGEKFEPKVDTIAVDSTLANLIAARDGEMYEAQAMYPDMIVTAQKEGAKGAEQSFDWAMKAEVKHAQFYEAAIAALQTNGNDATMEAMWYVCPKCGDTYLGSAKTDLCQLCGTNMEQAIAFTE